jgi:hypothetical protein
MTQQQGASWLEAMRAGQAHFARALAPAAPSVLMSLGRACYLLGKQDEAFEACHTTVALAPGADAYTKLGVILRGSWRLDFSWVIGSSGLRRHRAARSTRRATQ